MILGAGASYDSLAREPPKVRLFPGDQWRPPLANELFQSRWGNYIQQFPQAHALIPDLEQANIDVEGRLEQFQNEASEHPRRLVQLAAVRYYLQAMLSECIRQWEAVTRGVTNYKALLDQIDHRVRDEKLFVTFNYDTLLEDALPSTVGVHIQGFSDYAKSDYKVVKLHGSIDWWHKVEKPEFNMNETEPQLRNGVIESGAKIQINPSFEFVRRDTTPTRIGKPLIPALSIPVTKKSDFECPQNQISVMTDALPHVDKILVVGWRATEEQFLNILGAMIDKKALSVMIVSGSKQSGSRIFTKIEEVRERETQDTLLTTEGGLSKAILSHEVDEFLKGNA